MSDIEHAEWLRDRQAQKEATLLRKKGHKKILKPGGVDEPAVVGESAESEELVDEYLEDGDEEEKTEEG